MIAKNQAFTLKVERLGSEMEGVGFYEGQTVFVPMALPGETAECQATLVKPRYAFARLTHLVDESPSRREPFCMSYRLCGGCSAQHMSYELTLEQKREQVADCLRKIAGIPDAVVPPVLGAQEPTRCRNKTSLPVGGSKEDPDIGFYRRRSHDIVPIDLCPIAMGDVAGVIGCVKDWMRQSHIKPYNEITGEGLVRHVVTRVNRLGDMMVLIVATSEDLPDAPYLTELLKKRVSGFRALHVSKNIRRDNVILGETSKRLYGAEFITETLLGLTFEISPLSFFQVNPAQTERLYGVALDFLNLQGGETCVDAYAGAGTIALCMAQKAARVIGVEIVPQAVESARSNAQRNGVENAEFLLGAVEEELPKLVENGLRPDAIMLDPPRKGVEKSVIEAIARSGVKRLCYVSCYPPTQARDIALLMEKGFRLVKTQPVDMFCYASGVENVALLEKP